MTTQISQRGIQKQFDVIVIGSGIAGLTYILRLLKINPQIKIALLTKKLLADSNSFYAQGGIATASSEQSIALHIADTLAAGDGLCYQDAVEIILNQGHNGIAELIKHGVQFDQDKDDYHLIQEGGHSERRIYHTGDHTGASIINALIEQVLQKSQVTIFENHIALNLITQNQRHIPGHFPEVIGAYVLNENTGKIDVFHAQITILATGGAGKVYRYTTNPDVATGDGVAMAYRAGARLGGMEFYQFHPTLFYHPTLNNFLITEAMRGEGAYLLHPETHERFMYRYAPERLELATRDIVARAIFTEIERSEQNFVYLDIRHRDRNFLQQRFPTIYSTLQQLGIEIDRDLIPVVPAAHYLCGGVVTDHKGRTDLPRLYAIGETAFTGLHGANRLASNSLLEGLVMADLAALDSLHWLKSPVVHLRTIADWDSHSVIDLRRASQIHAHWRSLRGEMTSYAGIVRTEAGLRDLLNLIQIRRESIENYYWKYTITRDLIELRNISLVAELIVRAALYRQESRGTHYREDYPQRNECADEILMRLSERELIFSVD
jgi:L-aspartate oxidase